MQDLASLKATLDQAQGAVDRIGYGSVAGRRSTDARNALAQAQAAYNAAVMQGNPGGNARGAVGTAESNWANALKNTEGRGDAVMDDPYTKAALERFSGVLKGADVPYTQQVQSQLLSRQADAGAAALGAQREMLAEQMGALGGSMADPAAQAALRRLMASNQAQNNANLGDMQSRATLTNFGAKNDAAASLAGTRGAQLGMANGQYNQAAQMYANQQLAGQRTSAAPPQQGGMDPNFVAWLMSQNQGNQTNQGNGQQQQTRQPQAPQPAAKPQPNMNQYGGYGSSAYGPKPAPARPQIPPNSQSYQNGVNTATGMTYGTGWATGANGQRINISQPTGLYNPNRPVY